MNNEIEITVGLERHLKIYHKSNKGCRILKKLKIIQIIFSKVKKEFMLKIKI